MRAKSLLLLLIALGCGVVASVAVSQVVLDKREGTGVPTAEILVIAKNISAASRIMPDSVRMEPWPADKVPQGALRDIKQIEGKFAKQPLYANEPLIEAKLANKGKETIVPDGYLVFDLVVTDHTGGSGYISPGDRVNVFGFFDKGNRANASKTIPVMENLEVWMVDGVASVDPEAGTTGRRSSNTFQLLVKDKQYSVLDTAANLGKLRVALRPPEDPGQHINKLDNGDAFLDWLRQSESGKGSESNVSKSESMNFDQFATQVEHEMTIVTPSGNSRFQWRQGDKHPHKIDEDADIPAGQSISGIQSGMYPPAYPFPGMPVTTGPPVPPSALVPGKSPVDPRGASSGSFPSYAPSFPNAGGAPNGSGADGNPNMKWDPSSNTWQSGELKASNPAPK